MSALRTTLLSLAAATVFAASGASAAVYPDASNENFDGNAHMDITSVEVTNDLSDITFKITVREFTADWGKYLVGISKTAGVGDTATNGNAWGRNLRMADGMESFLGSWVDFGGGLQPWTHSVTGWTQNGSGPVSVDGNVITLTTSLASLGLAPGQLISFDVYTTGGGGGDSANDAAANPLQSISDWPGPYTTAAGTGLQYTVVPEPASMSVIALGALGLLARRRRG